MARQATPAPGEPRIAGPATTSMGGDPPCEAYGASYRSEGDSDVDGRFETGSDDLCEGSFGVDQAGISLREDRSPTTATSRFVLAEARSYVDFVRAQRHTDFYDRPDLSRRTGAYVVADDYLAVLQRASDWLLVDFMAPRGDTRGWVKREDLARGRWVPQKASTPRFTFAVACTTAPGPNLPLTGVDAVQVFERASGRRVQALYDYGAFGRMPCDEMVHAVDANFDGYPDMAIFAQDGGAGPNFSNNYYLFEPRTGLFVYHEDLSNLTQPEIDPTKKEVRSASRNGAMEHGKAATAGSADTLSSSRGPWRRAASSRMISAPAR